MVFYLPYIILYYNISDSIFAVIDEPVGLCNALALCTNPRVLCEWSSISLQAPNLPEIKLR